MRFQDKIAIGLQATGATPSAAYSAAKAGACADQEPRDRAGALQDTRERDCTRCHRDAGVQYLLDARAVAAVLPTFNAMRPEGVSMLRLVSTVCWLPMTYSFGIAA